MGGHAERQVPQGNKGGKIGLFQRGAVDGLSMVVPHGDPDYYGARGAIAIARPASGQADTTVDLDGFFGLHPAMAPLKPLWDARRLAIVHACGSPDATRSHFDAQDYMETATPGIKSTPDGWLNRYLHAREHEKATPFRAVALASQLPRALQGIAPALAMGNTVVLKPAEFTSLTALRFAELCDLASRYGIRAHLEFMVWTDAKDLVQAAWIVERAGRDDGGILVDAFHFSRSRCRIADIARVPPARFGYMQLGDVPAAVPPTMDAILAEARAERRFPGEGELDLAALVGALPPGIPVSVEVPTVELAKSMPALERARRAIAGARAVLGQVGDAPGRPSAAAAVAR